jgi:hypothetical protein
VRWAGHLSRTNGSVFLLTAYWEILAPSFGLVTRLGHINIWNTSSFRKYVFPFRSITLRSHQFVIKPRRARSCSRQWKYLCDFCDLVLGYLRDLWCRSKSALGLFTILRLLKRLFRTMRGDFRSDLPAARINHGTCKETRNSSHQCETIHCRGNFKPQLLEHANLNLHKLPSGQVLTSYYPTCPR